MEIGKYPKNIFLESSILWQLPLHVLNASVERLLKLCKTLGVRVFIPEVSFKEWMEKIKKRIKGCVSQAENALREMASVFDYVSEVNWGKSEEEIISEIEGIILKIIKDQGILIAKTPKIDLNKLIDMSISKIEPFEKKGEKGFRDSINLFTVLEYIKNDKKHEHVLISKDNIYQADGIHENIVKKYNTELVVATSISEVIEGLEIYMRKISRINELYDQLILQNFLLENQKTISEYIEKESEFSKSFLSIPIYTEISSIDSIEIINIPSVTRGAKSTGEGRVKLSFTVATEVFFTIVENDFPPEPKYKIKEEPLSRLALALAGVQPSSPRRGLKGKSIKVNVSIEGSAIFKKEVKQAEGDREDSYSDLQLDRVMTD